MMLPLAVPTLILSSVLFGPPVLVLAPEDVAPVQSPAVGPAEPGTPSPPTLPEPPEGGVLGSPEGDPVVAAPAEPEPSPTPIVEAPAPAPVPTAAPTFDTPPALDPLDRDWVSVRAPNFRGTGQFIAAGTLYALAVVFQAGDTLACGDCATGVFERVLLFTSMGLAAGGGVNRGHADAYDDTALKRERPDTRRALIAGATMTGVGAVLGLVNEGLWWGCVLGDAGPYQGNADFFSEYDCRYGISRGVLDVASATTATGLALMTWSLTYKRDARAYSRARVIGFRPTFSRERWALAIEGRF